MTQRRLLLLLKPATDTPVGRALADLARVKAELVTENALLRQVRRPALTPAERLRLLLSARRSLSLWRHAALA